MSNNINVNFVKKDDNNIYLESLNDGGKNIKVDTEIPILNISDNGEYAKVGNFDNEINKILNKDTEKEKLEIEKIVVPYTETVNIDDSQALVPAESGVGEGFIPNDNEVANNISQKIITFITNKDINKNLTGEKLLNIQVPIKIFTEKVLDNIKKLSKNGNSTGTSESALIVYEPNTLIENRNKIVNTIKDEFENNVFTVNQDLKNIFDENSRAQLYDEILNIFKTDFEKVNSGETEINKNVEGCSDEFTTTKKVIEDRFKELIKKDFKQVNKDTDCKNVNKTEFRDYSLKVSQDKNPNCIAAKEMQQNLNNIKSVCIDAIGNGDENAIGNEIGNGDENAIGNEIGNVDNNAIGNEIGNVDNELHELNEKRKEIFLNIKKYDNENIPAVSKYIETANQYNVNTLTEYKKNNIVGMKENIKKMEEIYNLLPDVVQKTKGGNKKSTNAKTKKSIKAGKKKSKKVRFVMTKKGRKNKKNRTRR